eukprot:CAMPEP_0185708274 /NCGR_PEP_ID=MMETSP1164-20130828/26173_1 /TAXON_ID=1104430 /ORGANISM="Chrysoreinhardia sp, Strain CCMP2950" /LENGTH=428 /DNA_ID=CAMNT_0028375719 /DNA_START=21 /DNA_END=1307 /DNA_ORIENTATION=-
MQRLLQLKGGPRGVVASGALVVATALVLLVAPAVTSLVWTDEEPPWLSVEGLSVVTRSGRRRRLLEYDFSRRKLKILVGLAIGIASVSAVGGVFVVTSFLKFDRVRGNFGFELVANMSACDLGACVTYFFGAPRDRSPLCTSQAVVQSFFEMASVLFATVIATTLHVAIRRREAVDARAWRASVYLYAYGAAAFLAVMPLTTSSYGSAGAWCWIRTKPRSESHAWRFSVFYVPVWIAIAYNAKVYGECAFVLHRLSTIGGDDAASQKLKRTVTRLARYPLVLVLAWVFPTINRLQQTAQHTPLFWLYCLTVLSRGALGAMNAAVFGTTEQVRAEWRACFAERRYWSAFSVLSSRSATNHHDVEHDDDDDATTTNGVELRNKKRHGVELEGPSPSSVEAAAGDIVDPGPPGRTRSVDDDLDDGFERVDL